MSGSDRVTEHGAKQQKLIGGEALRRPVGREPENFCYGGQTYQAAVISATLCLRQVVPCSPPFRTNQPWSRQQHGSGASGETSVNTNSCILQCRDYPRTSPIMLLPIKPSGLRARPTQLMSSVGLTMFGTIYPGKILAAAQRLFTSVDRGVTLAHFICCQERSLAPSSSMQRMFDLHRGKGGYT